MTSPMMNGVSPAAMAWSAVVNASTGVPQPSHAEGVDDDAPGEKRRDRGGHGAVLAPLRQQTDHVRRDDEPDEVTRGRARRSLPATLGLRVERQPGRPQTPVKGLAGGTETAPEGGSGEQDREGLARDRDGSERQRDDDLRRQGRSAARTRPPDDARHGTAGQHGSGDHSGRLSRVHPCAPSSRAVLSVERTAGAWLSGMRRR